MLGRVGRSSALVVAVGMRVALADLLALEHVRVGDDTLVPDVVTRLCARHPLDEQWVIDQQLKFMDGAQRTIIGGFLRQLRLLDRPDLQELKRRRVPPKLRYSIDALAETEQPPDDDESELPDPA